MSHGNTDAPARNAEADVPSDAQRTNKSGGRKPVAKPASTPASRAKRAGAAVTKQDDDALTTAAAPALTKAPAKSLTKAPAKSLTKAPAKSLTKAPAKTKPAAKKASAETTTDAAQPTAVRKSAARPATKPAAKKPTTKSPAAQKPAKRPAATKPATASKSPTRLATAAQNAPVAAELVSVPAIDHSPDLSLGGVDAALTLPVVDETASADVVAEAIDHSPDLSRGGVDAPVALPSDEDPASAGHAVTESAKALTEPLVAEHDMAAATETALPVALERPEAPTIAEVPSATAAATTTDDKAAATPQPEVPLATVPARPAVVPAALVTNTPVPRAASATSSSSEQPDHIALQITGLTKSFGGQRVVDAIDLTVPAGTFYGIVGPNGAGKTTTLSMIAGLLKPDAGTIVINGIDARHDARAARKIIGVLPDRLRTFDRLTGKQLLSYFGALRGLPGRTIDQRVADLARAFDLTEALGRVVSDYSAGMTKKVMMAGALIHSPRVLILDEPFESVDPVSSTVILDILTAYVNNGGTVILSSHGMDLVERVCSRLAVIVAGQVLAEGTVEDVRGGVTLEQRFVELSGGVSDAEGLEWLHTYSA